MGAREDEYAQYLREMEYNQYLSEQESATGGAAPATVGEAEAEPVLEEGVLDATDVGYHEATVRNIGEGAHRTWDAVKDLAYRGDEMIQGWAGNDSVDHTDALSGILRDQKERAHKLSAINEKHPIPAFVGGLVGETAAIAPIGLAARGGLMAARGATALSRNASFGVAAGEGLATGVVGTHGDLEDRLKGGIIEAGLGGSMQAVGDAVGGYFRQGARARAAMKDGVAADEANIAAQRNLVREEGGYTQDTADITGSQIALDYRDKARGAADRSTLEFEAQQERDIAAKANSFGDGTGGVQRTDIEQGEAVQGALTKLRDGDLKAVDKAYDAWRASHGSNTMVDTGKFFDTLDSVQLNSKQKEFRKTIDKVLEENGVKDGVPMSIDQVEKVIIDINSHWDRATPQYNDAAGAYKEALDKYVIEGFGDISNLPANHPVRLGKEARMKAKAMNDEWSRGDILDKITKIPKGSTEHSLRALDGIRMLKQKGNYKDLRSVKLMLDKTPEGKQVWKDIQASEIFEAVEKAMPNIKARKKADGLQDVVDGKAFNTRLNRMDRESQVVMFGEKKADEMQRAAERWSERGRTTSTRGDPGVSGTARAVSQGVVRLAASRGAGGDVLAVVPFIGQFFDKRHMRKVVAANKLGQSGGLSAEGKVELENIILEEFKKNLSPEIVTRHMGTINNLIRSMVRGDDEDTGGSDSSQ